MVSGNKILIGKMMKLIKLDSSRLIIRFFSFLTIITLCVSCQKDAPVAPVAGSFEVTHDLPDIIPASGGVFNLIIDGTTNGWWILKSENVSWVTINRMYGSAKVSQQVTVKANTENETRELIIEVKCTNQETKIIKVKQEG